MLLRSLFRMGESDYLYDNLNAEAILRKRKIDIFLLFLLAHIEIEICVSFFDKRTTSVE